MNERHAETIYGMMLIIIIEKGDVYEEGNLFDLGGLTVRFNGLCGRG
jgi:hypothetical protein